MKCKNFLCHGYSIRSSCNYNAVFSGQDYFIKDCKKRKMYNRIINKIAGIDGIFREERDKYYGRK